MKTEAAVMMPKRDVNYHDIGGHKLFCNANNYLPVEMATYPKIPESSTLLCGEFSSINILNR